MESVICVATEADARGIAEVVVFTWRVVYKGIISDDGLASLSIDERERCWRERLRGNDPDSADWTTLVCEIGGKIIGFTTHRPCGDEDKDRSSVGELLAIYLLPEYWGKGIGKQMLDEVINHFKQQAVSEISLWVIESNQRARRFYELAGFQSDGVKKSETKLGTSVVLMRYVRDQRKRN
jgi:ribosomal protein S18 acetylase RimI-like enzyme